MNRKYSKLAVVGGDRRFSALVSRMRENGLNVSACALDVNDGTPETLASCLDGAAAVILPLPVSGDGIYANAPFCKTPPKICEVFGLAYGKLLLGGRFSPAVSAEADRRGIRTIDYYDDETLKLRNAVPAAEGAISVAMNALDVTLDASRAVITGYGRIGKALAPRLKALGASVTVAARRSADVEAAVAVGFDGIRITHESGFSSLTDVCRGYDVIFNTVPAWIFDAELVALMPVGTLFIDLASAPGGIDEKAAKERGIRLIKAPSLPGSYAPVTAGRIICDCVTEILEKENII